MKTTSEKNTDIQILRAIAILLVIAQHIRSRLPTPQAYHEIFDHVTFWPGVDIFFAISGFLICKTFFRDMQTSQTKTSAIKSFWIRRVARLLPAVVFWGVTSIAISFYTSSYPNTNPSLVAKSALTGILGVSNIYWASCVQFALECGSADYNAVTWSLSLEWQLYALSTLLFVATGFRKGIIILAAISIIMSFLPSPSFSFPWVFRPQAFVIGALIFLIGTEKSKALNPSANIALLFTGLLICLLSPINIPQPFTVPAISVGAGLCLYSTLGGSSIPPLIGGFFSWIGERSYSIYLCHLPMILFSREILNTLSLTAPSNINFFIGIVIATALIAFMSEASYKFIELPFQRKLSNRRPEINLATQQTTTPQL
ncbi:acyltransferase [Pseudomonas sp. B15(2017)]|uniref:acyltransferase family protein n=1 Tax=Pseudomonas sp. B15(2017) TaxID=1981744 RepID=UPI001593B70D|nr:acyltransferase [Pseudomonas sp. B15(2017)]